MSEHSLGGIFDGFIAEMMAADSAWCANAVSAWDPCGAGGVLRGDVPRVVGLLKRLGRAW